ncbi:hypothetical protein N7536_011366 [Penicillium majusculum]|uniref:Amino acid permease/ SLC12A domain-containing protein n=1 Tax=Penicillium solitum TaxID=60172 RepID=A0A1V6QYF7_9EURO|nr:uncharacterized protein PENSOL_c027G05982 [Penicillium solitum]KAJ5680227.1 hypothetical protein N7536_011366 [Penicillium majusculum]OQD94214.1 hypothetical protein PENSOL_c027G05982 [Penicillium solitum]
MDNIRFSSDKHNNGNEKDVYETMPRADSFAVEEPLRLQSTKRDLKARHALFIAWGGTVGTGLFITTGKTLATGGPAFLVGSYVFISILVYFILTGVIEMATFLPVRGGSMSRYGSLFVSKSLGFAMGWLYVYSFAILVPFELTACAILIDYWQPGINSAVWITILLVLLVILNVLPVRFYGEAEFIFTGVKLATIIGLLILSFILFWGGGPDRNRLGFHYWKDPGAANTLILEGDAGRLVAAIATVISSLLPFTLTPEMVVGTAAEIREPMKNVPRVAKHFTWRLVVLFVGSVIGISVVCPSNASTLTSGSDAASSPWVAGIRQAGIPVLDSIINAVALIAAWSTGNAFLYLSSRCLHSMAMEGSAPRIFQRCTAKGVPIYAVGATSCVALLAYMTLNSSSATVLNWLLNLVNTGGLLSWVSCSITYLRFRRACEIQGVPKPQLTQRSLLQPYASWITLVVFSILTLLNGFTVFFPSEWSTASFLSAYIGLPVFLILYFGHRFVYRKDPWAIPSEFVDLRLDPAELE